MDSENSSPLIQQGQPTADQLFDVKKQNARFTWALLHLDFPDPA